MDDRSISHGPRSLKRTRLSHDAYTIAFILPLSVELAPLRGMLDAVHDDLPLTRDFNSYVLGEIGHHNVVIAVLPSTGNNDSGAVASQLINDFPHIRFGLLVGIGGGVPDIHGHIDIRLGDVVVSEAVGSTGAVVQLDRGKQIAGGQFQWTGHLNKPSPLLAATVKKLKAQHQQEGHQIHRFISDMLRRNPEMRTSTYYPDHQSDHLFESDYDHEGSHNHNCSDCDLRRTVKRASRESHIRIHYGPIGSSNSVIKNAVERDGLSRQFKILSVEMEAAGLMDTLPCLVIRGICDYADSHKNKSWQPYAAATAAAYAKELLQAVPPESVTLSTRSTFSQDSSNTVLTPATREEPWANEPTPDVSGSLLRQLYDSLSFDRMDARLRNVAEALPQTSTWLFENANFIEWNERSQVEIHHGFLWIKGKPGSGKSTIMKNALAWMQKTQTKDIIISYFFNARATDSLEKSSTGLYRSLTLQIVQKMPHTHAYFLDQFSSKVGKSSADVWTASELQNFLIYTAKNLQGECLNIFIDALDEGEESDIRQLVSFLTDLGSSAVHSNSTLRICLSSRHYPNVSVRKAMTVNVEDQSGHETDISTYVENKLVTEASADMDMLRLKVCQKASNVFLWVVLVVPVLNAAYDRGRLDEMSQALNDIPEELDGLFERLLAQRTEDTEASRELFTWMFFARQPLSISALYTVVRRRPKQDTLSCNAHAMYRYLLDVSRGLIEATTTEPPTVQFIHETVRTFLTKNGLRQLTSLSDLDLQRDSQEMIKNICLEYIKDNAQHIVDFRLGRKGANHKNYMRRTLDAYPLLQYAVSQLLGHADAAQSYGVEQRDFLKRFTAPGETSQFQTWVRMRNNIDGSQARRYTTNVELLYVLADYGCTNLVRTCFKLKRTFGFLTQLLRPLIDGERFEFPLQAACAAGHEETVRALVELGADVNAEGGECHCAVLASILRRKTNITQYLIQNGARAPQEHLQTTLFKCIARRYLEGLQNLIRLGVNLHCTNGRGRTPIECAITRGDIDVMKLLSANGACDHLSDLATTVSEALRWVMPPFQVGEVMSRCYHLAMSGKVTTAPRSSARTRSEFSARSDPASERAVMDLVVHLKSSPPDVSEVTENLADLVQILLSIEIRTFTLQEALNRVLSQMLRLCREEMACRSIKCSATINAQFPRVGISHFCGVIRELFLHFARTLVQWGARVDRASLEHQKALQHACLRDDLGLVLLLIKSGIDVNLASKNPLGQTRHPLFEACVMGRTAIVDALLKAGADVNAKSTSEYRGMKNADAFIAAISFGDIEVVKLLVQHGADVDSSIRLLHDYDWQGTYGLESVLSELKDRNMLEVHDFLVEHLANQ